MNVVVAIPIYKEALTVTEQISLAQVRRVLGSHPIVFFAPQSLTVDYGALSEGIPIERFDDSCFQHYGSYSALLLSDEFYARFSAYDYMLIYQLDAFVFSDRLAEFCAMGYDYIGAPTFPAHPLWHGLGIRVGNGGLSLRRIAACRRMLAERGLPKTEDTLYSDIIAMMEDLYWSWCGTKPDYGFRCAPIDVALTFSVQDDVQHAYARMERGDFLPFGCHGWEGSHADFWWNRIAAQGYGDKLAGQHRATPNDARTYLLAAYLRQRRTLDIMPLWGALREHGYPSIEQRLSRALSAFPEEKAWEGLAIDITFFMMALMKEVGAPSACASILRLADCLRRALAAGSISLMTGYIEQKAGILLRAAEVLRTTPPAPQETEKPAPPESPPESASVPLTVLFLADGDISFLNFQLKNISLILTGIEYELIVINDDPSDEFRAILADNRIRAILPGKSIGRAACLAKGMEAARGAAIILWQIDTLLTRAGFLKMLAALPESTPGLVGALGCGFYTEPSFRFRKGNPRDYRDIQGYLAFADRWADGSYGPHHTAQALLVEDGVTLLNRQAVEAVGTVDAAFGDDLTRTLWDYSLRVHQAGGQVLLAEEAFAHKRSEFLPISEEATKNGERVWETKWGFAPKYSMNTRFDVLDHIDGKKSPRTFLEAGCACGGDFVAIRDRIPEAACTGIELDEHSAKISKLFADVHAIDLETLDEPDWHDKFDVILCPDILEHLRDPWQTVRNLYRLQSPGGEILISVPNIMHWSIFYNLLRGNWTYTDAGLLDRTHLRFFTGKTATALLTQAGYQISSIHRIRIVPNDAEQEAFTQSLVSLLAAGATHEDLLTFQWIIKGVKPTV